jgi:hypothetical protein
VSTLRDFFIPDDFFLWNSEFNLKFNLTSNLEQGQNEPKPTSARKPNIFQRLAGPYQRSPSANLKGVPTSKNSYNVSIINYG